MARTVQPADRQRSMSSVFRASRICGAVTSVDRCTGSSSPVFLPLGEVDRQLRAFEDLLDLRGVVQQGDGRCGHFPLLPDHERGPGPLLCRSLATLRAGESRTSSLLGLKAAPGQRSFCPSVNRPACPGPGSTALRRRLTLMVSMFFRKSRASSMPSSSARARKARMSLGRQPAAEADAGGKETVADPGIVAECRGEGHDVRPHRLADFRDGIDKGDLGRQERVGRNLHQLGRRHVRRDVGCPGVEDRCVHLSQHRFGLGRGHSDHEPVRDAACR